jgi:hypothetical protein
MTLRIKPLLFALLFPMLGASAGTWRSNADSGPLQPAYYPSQPHTHESPWRYGVPSGLDATGRLAYWSEQAWRTIAIDHTPPPAGPSAYAEQQGPTRTSRVMAIFHIAIYDALNAIYRRYPGYSGSCRPLPTACPMRPSPRPRTMCWPPSTRARPIAWMPRWPPTWPGCPAAARN